MISKAFRSAHTAIRLARSRNHPLDLVGRQVL
jgi:hypothetical protein